MDKLWIVLWHWKCVKPPGSLLALKRLREMIWRWILPSLPVVFSLMAKLWLMIAHGKINEWRVWRQIRLDSYMSALPLRAFGQGEFVTTLVWKYISRYGEFCLLWPRQGVELWTYSVAFQRRHELARYVRVSVLIKFSHGRVALLYARPANKQLRGISLVNR